MCSFVPNADGLALYRSQCLSNINCKPCLCISMSKAWLCSCGVEWPNCGQHFPIGKNNKTSIPSRKLELKRKFGTDKRFPMHRVDRHASAVPPPSKKVKPSLEEESQPCTCTSFAPGSKLAAKFPLLVQGVSPTKGTDSWSRVPKIHIAPTQ